MKYTVSEFATHLKSLFPQQEISISDQELVDSWLQKHPEDRDKIILERILESKTEKTFNLFGNFLNKVWTFLVLFIILWGVLSMNNVPIVRDINQGILSSFENKEDIEEVVNAVFDPNDQHETPPVNDNILEKIPIDEIIKAKVDSNPIVAYLKLDDDTKTAITQILSDPNPDPNNLNGEYCGDVISHCKYCSNAIANPKFNRSIQESLKVRLFNRKINLYVSEIINAQNSLQESENKSDSDVNWGGLMLEGMLSEVKGWEDDLRDACNLYREGFKYRCEFFEKRNGFLGINITGKVKEFCSLRCQDDYKYR